VLYDDYVEDYEEREKKLIVGGSVYGGRLE